MKIELPQTRSYGALFAVGQRLWGAANQQIGSIIVKASYLLTASGGPAAFAMNPNPDPAASAIVAADQGALFDDHANGMDVTREADIAPFKPLTDIVVEGFGSGLGVKGVELHVNGTLWLRRIEDIDGLSAASLADRNRHLFGYQPRTEAPRAGDAASDPNDKPKSLAEFDTYSNRFLNFHRRGGGFSASAAVADALSAGQTVTVHKVGPDDTLSDALSVTLSHPALTALYRTYCGSGPDQPPYWTRVRLGVMRADTLILRPDAGLAEVIWRAVWPWADEPVERYRALRVSEGVI
jgi:hypothetical protein